MARSTRRLFAAVEDERNDQILLGTFTSKKAAVQHEREIQYFKRH